MISLDTAEDEKWPQIGRGGHLRNRVGEALVIPPGGGRKRRAIGGSGLDVFYVYTGPENYGHQGSHVHTVTEHADDGRGVTDELVAAGEALGITAATTRHCHDSYLEFIDAMQWRTVLTECIVVNDDYSVPIASNIDKVMSTPDGHVVVDVKSSNSFDHRGYAMQLAAYVDSCIYDPTTGDRTPLPQPLDTARAFILSYTVRTEDPTWKLVEVDVNVGRDLLVEFDRLRSDERHTSAFQIAAPPTPPAGVEQPATDPERTATAPGSVATLDELRAEVATWEPVDSKALGQMLDDELVDRTDPVAVKAAMDRYRFRDVHTEPVARPEPQPTVVQKPLEFSEGLTLDEATIDAAGRRYLALDDDVRSWVSVCGALVRIKPPGGKPTERRMELLRGLCALAEAGFDADDMARAVLAHVIGDEAWQGAPVADLVGTLDLPEARRFAHLCDAVAGAEGVALHYQLDGRAVITPSVAA